MGKIFLGIVIGLGVAFVAFIVSVLAMWDST